MTVACVSKQKEHSKDEQLLKCITSKEEKNMDRKLYRDPHLGKNRLNENPSFPIAIGGRDNMSTSWNQSQHHSNGSTHSRCQ